MRLHAILLLLASLPMLACNDTVFAKDPSTDRRDMRQARKWLVALSGDGEADARGERCLLRMGERAFPAYEALLSDPKSPPEDVGKAFDVLGDVEADRRRFIKYVISWLTLPNGRHAVHHNGLLLLGDIGSAAEASPVVALLSDEKTDVVWTAAHTLADIGGQSEVVAMDVWLRGVSYRDKAYVREDVKKYRDELKKRLDDAKDPKKRAQQRQQAWKIFTSTEEEDVSAVHRAVRELSACGSETVAFFNDRVRSVPTDTQKRLDQLVADLDNDSFERREAASRELSRGVVAETVLEKALADRPTLEMRRRLEAILEDFPEWREKNPELLRSFRAVWVLQQIGTPEARTLLEKLAAGAPSAALTQKAKDALQSLDRLKKR